MSVAFLLTATGRAQEGDAQSLFERAMQLYQSRKPVKAYDALARIPAEQRTASMLALMGHLSTALDECERAATELRSALESNRGALDESARAAVNRDLRECRPRARSAGAVRAAPPPAAARPAHGGGHRAGGLRVEDFGGDIDLLPPQATEAMPESRPDYTVMKVFYATDRRQNAIDKVDKIYDGSRNETGTLAFGSCEVSIPHDHRMGEIERPSLLRFEFQADPARHVMVLSVKPESAAQFYASVAAKVDASPARDALVFVHGYNVEFVAAARRAAQLAYDLSFKGAPILYSWPSQGTETGYLADEASAQWSSDHLKQFLKTLAANTHATTVHVIAHSMGSAVLAGALHSLGEESPPTAELLREVVLVAPDIDAGVFRQLAAAFHKPAKHVTIYASANDRAMQIAYDVRNYRRLGDDRDGIVIVPDVDSIDVSPLETSTFGLNHSYFGDSRTVISDLYQLLHSGIGAKERSDLVEVVTSAGSYFQFRH